jgi:hypothetical protein
MGCHDPRSCPLTGHVQALTMSPHSPSFSLCGWCWEDAAGCMIQAVKFGRVLGVAGNLP